MSIRMIAVDFDGTICDFRFPGTGEPKKGVKQALDKFRELGYHVIIYSCRACDWFSEEFMPDSHKHRVDRKVFKDMIAYLRAHQIPYDSIDDGSKGKPPADYYIDDKAVRFENNWNEIQQFVEVRALLEESIRR